MRGHIRFMAAAVVLVAIVAASTPSAAATSTGSEPTYKIGVLTDLTGLLASSEHTSPLGVEAGVGLAAKEGYKIQYVVVDDTSSPAGALAGAQRLVEQDHVSAVVLDSGVGFGAAPYLTSQGIPVFGADVDGPEWVTSKNMFSIFGYANFAEVETTFGKFLKLVGAKDFASVGYGISPSSSEAAQASAISAQLAGLKVGYLNSDFPFGTNVAPIVLAMKNAHVDSFIGDVEQNTSFAILAGLQQNGVHLKAPILAVGYGGDLLQAGKEAEKQATGAYFTGEYEPVEMHTAATERFVNAMKTYAHIPSDEITDNEYIGFLSVDALVTGLKAAGGHPSQSQLINTMLGIRHYDAAGLWGTHTEGFAMDQRGIGSGGPDNCAWFVKWTGGSFQLVSGADPICGTVVAGKTVSASS
ncbi:MAG: ABC transporter substrate-binding protein [Acidimicrobiales bacterium]